MRFTVLFLLLSFLLIPASLSANTYAAKTRYSVEFSATMGSCTGKETTTAFVRHFGDRDKSGACLDNPSLQCQTRFTYSFSGPIGQSLVASPRICGGQRGKNCSEMQFSFEHAPASDADVLNLTSFELRGRKTFSPRPVRINVAETLGQTKRYVLTLDACRYTIMSFRVAERKPL